MEEKGYWFSLENGTHIHAEEGESPKEATQKKLKSFKNPKNAKTEQTSLKEGVNKLVEDSKGETIEEKTFRETGYTAEDVKKMEKEYDDYVMGKGPKPTKEDTYDIIKDKISKGEIKTEDDFNKAVNKLTSTNGPLTNPQFVEFYKQLKVPPFDKDDMKMSLVVSGDYAKQKPTSLKEGVDQLEKDSKKGFSNFGNQIDQEKAKEAHTKELTDYIKQMIETHDYEGSIEDIAEKIYYDSPYSIHSHDEMYEIAYNMLSEKQQSKIQPKAEEPKEKSLDDYTDQLFKEANVTTYTTKKGKNPKGEIVEIRRFGEGQNAIRYNETLNKVEQVWINGKRVV